MAVKVAVFDAKSYDRESLIANNKNYGFELSFYKDRLSMHTVDIAKGKELANEVK